jgi:sec-independent protein translocase protein TatB
MFGIGGQELIFILILALIVLGPSKLPEIAKTLGKVMGEFNRATSDLKREIDLASQEPPKAPDHPAEAPPKEEKPEVKPDDIVKKAMEAGTPSDEKPQDYFKEVREESELAEAHGPGPAGTPEENKG